MQSEGQRLLEEGRFEQALACFESEDSAFGRAVALQLLRRFDEAESLYEQILSTDPEHSEALANLIALHVEQFRLESVEKYSRRLLAVHPDAPIALQGLLVVAVERREYKLAANCFARLKPLPPDGRDAVEYRLSRQVVERLKDQHGSLANPY